MPATARVDCGAGRAHNLKDLWNTLHILEFKTLLTLDLQIKINFVKYVANHHATLIPFVTTETIELNLDSMN